MVAIALEQGQNPGFLHHPPGQQPVERRQAQGLVVKHFGKGAARAEAEHRAEIFVGLAADQQFKIRMGNEGLD